MKIKFRFLIPLLILLCALCTAAGAQSSYQELMDQARLKNPHVAAWLDIPGANLTLPVMLHPTDDAYYASRDASGQDKTGGSVYVQAGYNAAGFNDPVTLLYGNSAREDAPFGMLQQTFSGSFESCRTIRLHLPEETREYQVFAAVPYSSIHILHYYDFTVQRRYNNFFDSVFSTRALGMHLDEDNRPEPSEKVLILSTSVRGDKTRRYLVMAKQIPQ